MDINKETSRGDLTINGTGRAAGGWYRYVNVDGIATINGSVKCETLRVNGISKIKGGIEADRLDVNGIMNGEGDIAANTVAIDGKVRMRGSVAGDAIRLNGWLKLSGDCEAEKVIVHGGFELDGLLNAGQIEIGLQARCRVNEIGGTSIRVKRTNKRWVGPLRYLVPMIVPKLETQMIEGDDVTLEATSAGIVRGRSVIIGPDCTIGRVEYKTELKVDPSSTVRERIQI
ncbi:cytoskeletal protein CcmA (bactofilin family) [Paenibacillus cellulosilyticus]|uniref:Cytoskeletal protein CcmA (Bactofilin family) n=1 Tax=Paenibacillus cellulosilyticus TaxID=375489 RepID=A0A2V2YFB3_9BACL|nr:polymer-forming cytoskeletal protein [Paenibacillus cellulosilyticus]PWV90654.1 cytoskeletal protein CcmA (bactofilin family) [Paenibacillus cellulosilyticus]QKS43924.1 polymer-forming cytoskeletal protein [Paenibacillus cellulosilyticus]